MTGFYQNDRSRYTSNRELDNKRFPFNSTGGALYHGRINSVWNNQLTTAFAFNYNDKRGNDESTYDDSTHRTAAHIHQSAFARPAPRSAPARWLSWTIRSRSRFPIRT